MADPTPAQQKFINNELKLMAQQDKQLGKAQHRDDQKTIAALGRDSKRYSQLAAKYSPVEAQNMTGLSDSARDRILANQARTNAIGSAQASGLAKEIASQGKNATDFMRTMRSSNPARHREYVQYLHNIKPGLLEQKQAADFRERLAEQEFGLQQDTFNESKRQFDATLEAGGGLSNKDAAKARVDRQKAAQGVYDSLYRLEDIYSKGNMLEGPRKTGEKKLVGPKNPFRAGFQALREKGFGPDQAAKMAFSWANRYAEEVGSPVWKTLGVVSEEELARMLSGWGVSSKMYNRINNQIR